MFNVYTGRGFTDFISLSQMSNFYFFFQSEINRLCGLNSLHTVSTGRKSDERHVDNSLTVTSVRHLIRVRSADLSVSVLQASSWLLATRVLEPE